MVDNLLHIAKNNACRNLAMHFDYRNPITRPNYERYLKINVFKQYCIPSPSLFEGCIIKKDHIKNKAESKQKKEQQKRAAIAEGGHENVINFVPNLQDCTMIANLTESNCLQNFYNVIESSYEK